MARSRRPRQPFPARRPIAPQPGRQARHERAPDLSAEQRECLAVACAGGGVAAADDRPVIELHELGLVLLQGRQADECRFVASAEGQRVAAILAAESRAA